MNRVVIRVVIMVSVLAGLSAYGNYSPGEKEVVKASLSGTLVPEIAEDKAGEEPSIREQAETRLSLLYSQVFADEATRPSYILFRKGMVGYLNLLAQDKLENANILTLIDFSLPSTQKRLWIVDLAQKQVLFHDLVAHGKNSGGDMATKFSNTPNSNMSSLGFYVTAHRYTGKHGLSLRLSGQEEGFNSNAMRRAVVMHGANYVNTGICKSIGRLGRSFGCPSVSMDIYQDVINTIADGSCLFIYHPSKEYNTASSLLKEETTAFELLLTATY